MKINTLIIGLFASIISSKICSGTMGAESNSSGCTYKNSNNAQKLITLSIGPAWNKNGTTQTLNLLPNLSNTYYAKHNRNILPFGEIFLGVQNRLNHLLYNQIGLEIGGGSKAELKGNIFEYNNPKLNNATYSYNISELRFLAKTKFLIDIDYYGTMPFISAGLGLGFNKSYNFVISPVSQVEVSNQLFTTRTKNVLTYMLGFGLEEKLNDNWRSSIGYEFADWGTSQLGKAKIQKNGYGLLVNNVHINAILLSLTYIT